MTERSRSRALLAAAALFFAVGLLIVAWNVPLPLGAYSPGPVTDAVDSVEVEGVAAYDSEGELVMLTAAWQQINAFEALIAAADPTVDVLARNVVRRPDESDEDYRRRNLQAMDQSTAVAISVAVSRVAEDDETDVYVTGYAADTPAGEVLAIGDRILAVEGEPIETTEDLAGALEGRSPGDQVSIEVERDDESMGFSVELVAQEEEPDRPMIGIFVRDLPFWIEIDSGIVGGPSAGMMYTLAIIEAVTPGSLTDGRVVSGTGTIDPDGNVGGVGAIRQKVVASEAAGAEYMLVPEGNYQAAQTAPSRDLELVPVSHIDEALGFLADLRGE